MTVEDLARLIGGAVEGDGSREIRDVAGLESAGPDGLAFAEGERGLARAAHSRAGCILVPEGTSVPGRTTIATTHTKLAFIRAAELLCPGAKPQPGIHPAAVIAAGVELGAGVTVGPHVVIERGVRVGQGTCLGAGVTLGERVEVGSECVLYPRVTVYPGSRIGNRVVLHAGVVVGSDGFGYVFAEGRYHKFPQLGQVIIEDDVEIGSNSTIDRGSLGTTVIGAGTKIDNLCQIAHNVRIGRHCVVAAQSGVAGSAEIGDRAVLGGQVGISDHVRIEGGVMIGAKSGVYPGKLVRKGSVVSGIPARPLVDFKKQQAQLARLPKLAEKVKELERRMSRG